MILLVFEGQKDEPKIMATVKTLFFPKEEQLLCSYGTDTYTLWKEVQEHISNGFEADVFQIVKSRMHSRGDHSLDKYDTHEIEAIYLFFDYDPQNDKLGLPRINAAISSIIATFSDSMEQGQIYISYPMVEALYCENNLPDSSFISASATLEDCHSFKKWSKMFNMSSNRDYIQLRANKYGVVIETLTDDRISDLKKKWIELIRMNSAKANYICNCDSSVPTDVSQITQSIIFQHEVSDFVSKSSSVSVLSAFPLFLYEYFHGNGDF